MEGVLDFDINSYAYIQEASGEDQVEIRMELEDWLESELDADGIDFESIDTERTDENTLRVVACDHTGDIIGKGTIQFNEI